MSLARYRQDRWLSIGFLNCPTQLPFKRSPACKACSDEIKRWNWLFENSFKIERAINNFLWDQLCEKKKLNLVEGMSIPTYFRQRDAPSFRLRLNRSHGSNVSTATFRHTCHTFFFSDSRPKVWCSGNNEKIQLTRYEESVEEKKLLQNWVM